MLRQMLIAVTCGLFMINLFYLTRTIGATRTLEALEVDLQRLHARQERSFPVLSPQDLSEFITSTFQGAKRWNRERYPWATRYVVTGERERLGYVYDVKEDLHCPVCKNFRFLLALDPDGRIAGIQLVDHLDFYGAPMPLAEEAAFMRQFSARNERPVRSTATPAARIEYFALGRNVDAVTGATRSSKHMIRAVNAVLRLHRGSIAAAGRGRRNKTTPDGGNPP